MGCDGGTIPKRDELVRTKKKKEQNPKDVEKAAKWNNCHLSQEPLQKPIVADLLGNFYNKENVIEYLLDKSKYESGPEHVKSLKDVKELNLVANPSFESNKQENGDEFTALNRSQYICGITGLELNGSFKFYFVFTCGCVFSERAFKTIQNSKSKCLKCEKEFGDNDLIVLNPNSEDLELNMQKLKARKELAAKAKAEKKSKIVSSGNTESAKACTSGDSNKRSSSKLKTEHLPPQSDPASANVKKQKTIQEDPNTSEVYKSLFNTCEKAKNQTKGHWVTFNPQYF